MALTAHGLLLALLLVGGSAQAAVRLVLDNGFVLSLAPDGSALTREPQRLALPRRSDEDDDGHVQIYAVVPDYAAGRLYVVLNGWPPHRGTHVFDLATLAPRGYLDGVVDVVVPEDPKAPVLFARTVAAGGTYTGTAFDIAMMGTAEVHAELRSRSDPARVLATAEDDALSAVPQCYDRHTRSLPATEPGTRFDHGLRKVENPASPEEVAARKSGHTVHTAACRPDGDPLTVLVHTTIESGQVRKRVLELRRGAAGSKEPQRLTLGEKRAIEIQHVHSFHLLGEDGRFVVIAGGQPESIDWTSGRVQAARVGHPLWTQRSADRSTLYGFGHHYVYRSIVSDNYVEGGDRSFDNVVSRVRVVGDALVSDELPLPPELAEAVARQRDIERRRQSPDEGEAEAATAAAEGIRGESDAPPASALAARLGRIAIIAVIDD